MHSYNSRMQVQRIEDAVNNDPSQVLFDQHFEWGTSDNNGNLQSVVTNHGGPGYQQPVTFKEYYGYDQLNRVSGSFDKNINENLSWGGISSTIVTGMPGREAREDCRLWLNAAAIEWIFHEQPDPASRTMTRRGTRLTVEAYQLLYDAENRQKQSTDTTTGAIVGYQYDGDGRRVEKTSGSNYGVCVRCVRAVGGRIREWICRNTAVPCVVI